MKGEFLIKDDKVKKLIYLVFIISLLLCCVPKQEKVEKYIEDGIEVVMNHIEPYKIKGEPSIFTLEEEFVIDTERDEVIETGLFDIYGFTVDYEENIYFFKPPLSQGNLIFKFDKNSNFVTSFAPTGPGPGEIQYPIYQRINEQNELPVIDNRGNKLLLFNKNGDLIREIRLERKYASHGRVLPLENRKYLIEWMQKDHSGKFAQLHLSLFDDKFEEVKELDRYTQENFWQTGIYKFPPTVFLFRVSKGKIYVGNDDRDYEFRVYDLEGNLTRKIRKEYNLIEVPEKIKNGLQKTAASPGNPIKKVEIAKYMPPFQFFIADDEGRIFVMTYEEGENPKEYILDIFNSDGIFIGRISLEMCKITNPLLLPLYAQLKNSRFYCLHENESGYKELVVYKMKWK